MVNLDFKADLVYFNSQLRWKTTKEFNDPDFNPLEGKVSTWAQDGGNYKNPRKWMESTLPISSDGSVIGSWDDMADDDADEECGETMHVLLEEVDVHKYPKIVFAAAVAKDRIQKGETFADAHDPVVSIYDADTDELIGRSFLRSLLRNRCRPGLLLSSCRCICELHPCCNLCQGQNG